LKNSLLLFIIVFLCISCEDDSLPKPKAFLRLDYPKAKYEELKSNAPFTFEKNSQSREISAIKKAKDQSTLGIEIHYPTIKSTIFLTYKKINKANLKRYITDAKNSTQTHAKKADGISTEFYENFKNNVYGMLYEVAGNTASQIQFYATDSVKHFLIGALYFQVKPNYDSIIPAVDYLKKDIQHIMETLKWKQ